MSRSTTKKKKGKWSKKGSRSIREDTREQHLKVLAYYIRKEDEQESPRVCDERDIDDRFPIYLRHLLVKFSNHAKGEKSTTIDDYGSKHGWRIAIRMTDVSMKNYDSLEDIDVFRGVYQTKEPPPSTDGVIRMADYVNASINFTDTSKLTLQIPVVTLVINDCNSTRVTVRHVMSTVQIVNCANLTLVYEDAERDTDQIQISMDMCCDIRVILPLPRHSKKPLKMKVSRTDKVTAEFVPLKLDYRVDLTEELDFENVFHFPLEFNPINNDVIFNGKSLSKEDSPEPV